MILNIPPPGKPMTDLLLPIRTLNAPEIMPFTITILAVASFSLTASVNWARVDTVVTVPPEPPVVLDIFSVALESAIHRLSYPPFWVAYPKVALSETDARLAKRAFSGLQSTVGVGVAETAANKTVRMENTFMIVYQRTSKLIIYRE